MNDDRKKAFLELLHQHDMISARVEGAVLYEELRGAEKAKKEITEMLLSFISYPEGTIHDK